MRFMTTLLLIGTGALMGACDHTAEGLKEDSRNNAINASATIKDGFDNGANMAKKAAVEAKRAGEELSAASSLTPRIKNAINADPLLNADGNLIDVDTTKEKVSLNGHVNNAKLKTAAGKIVMEEMSKAKATQKFVNNLEIRAQK